MRSSPFLLASLAVLSTLGAAAVLPAPPAPDPARVVEDRAAALQKVNDLPGAAAALREAAALRRKRDELLAASEDLRRLAFVRFQQGALDDSEATWKECLAIRQRLAPGTAGEAAAWNGLGTVAYMRGNLDEAEELYGKALAIEESVAPEGLDCARTTGNLGLVAFYRGDLDRAEALFRRALDKHENIEREGVESAAPLNYLGVVAKNRGDYDSAEQYYARALAIFEKKSPGSLAVAGMENNLGLLCRERRDFEGAERHHRAALAIRRRLAPGGLDVAASLNNLGEIALLRGDPDAALPLLREALEIKQKSAPESLSVANTVVNMAEYQLRKNDAVGALAEAHRALEIRRRLAPASLDEADAFALVARAERQRGDLAAAVSDYGGALTAIEAQRRRIGGAEEERAAFSSRSIGYYRQAIDLLHDLHRDEEAFGVLERSRGRELLALSGARDLKVDANAPSDLLAERRVLDLGYDRTQQQIARIDPVRRREEAEKLVARLVDLRDRRAAIEQRIWSSSPRLRELESARALSLAETRAALDPGTAVLSFSVGEKRSLLFAVPAERSAPLAVAELHVGRDVLSREVGVFRDLLRQERDDPGVRFAREESGRRLGRLLLGPAGAVIAGARRILVCPDGPLHVLPFSALTVDGPGRPRYFAEWRPIYVDLSATVAKDRAKRRGSSGSPVLEMAAFGDPAAAGPGARREAGPYASVAERARSLGPLPESRAEVESIATVFRGSSSAFTGTDASESRAVAAIGGARFVHFACHSLLDSRFPLDSALVLAAPAVDRPGDDNGLLQAWEIYERVRLRADLVTLSACETALGTDAGGEGLVGLVRAFQFAGARSVLASLWNVSDRSTPAIMTRFYRAVRKGRPMAEALREVQLAGIRKGGKEGTPYYWAAFELFGDWR